MMTHEIDIKVGKLIRLRRMELGLSQQQLAEKAGITYQQIQKYEVAKNRVCASKLWFLAEVLEVPITYFFKDNSNMQHLSDLDSFTLLAKFSQIKNKGKRKAILNLVHNLGVE